jgi:5'-3' exonuclease
MNADVFSIWENLKAEKKAAQEKGINSITKKEVLIVDGMNTFLRCFMAIPTMNEDGLHTGGISGFLKSVGYAIKSYQPDRCIIVFDGVGGSLKRRKIYSEYKNHRKTKIRLNRVYDENLTDEDISMQKQLQRLVSYIQCLPVNVLIIDNVEADDVIAYLALNVFKDWNSTVMSSDRDFLQLINSNIKVWSPTKKRIYGPEDVLNEYGISSQNFVYYRTLSGDKSDNISALPGCGLKTILKAFPMLRDGSIQLNTLKDHADANKGGKYKIYDTISDNWSDVERNYALMQLTDTSLTTMAQLHIKEVIDQPIPKLNRFELVRQTSSDNLTNTIPNINRWMSECFDKLNNFIRD